MKNTTSTIYAQKPLRTDPKHVVIVEKKAVIIKNGKMTVKDVPYLQRIIRDFLFLQSDKCRKCGRKMIIPPRGEKNGKDNWATIEHKYGKKDLRRWTQNGGLFWTLYCYKCNQDKGVIDQCMLRNSTYSRLYPPIDIRDFLLNGGIQHPKAVLKPNTYIQMPVTSKSTKP